MAVNAKFGRSSARWARISRVEAPLRVATACYILMQRTLLSSRLRRKSASSRSWASSASLAGPLHASMLSSSPYNAALVSLVVSGIALFTPPVLIDSPAVPQAAPPNLQRQGAPMGRRGKRGAPTRMKQRRIVVEVGWSGFLWSRSCDPPAATADDIRGPLGPS